nr:MAG TPA: hypothetical protein [Caudoviricetes sp.]
MRGCMSVMHNCLGKRIYKRLSAVRKISGKNSLLFSVA